MTEAGFAASGNGNPLRNSQSLPVHQSHEGQTVEASRRKFILASGSPRRREILTEHGFLFEVLPADCPEPPLPHLTPAELALRHALTKALHVARNHPARLVLAADTVVALGPEAFGKPVDEADAARMLSLLSGRTHQVYTAAYVVGPDAKRTPGLVGFVECSDVTFRPLSPLQIREYVSLTQPLDKAGAYGAQAHASLIIEDIRGSRNNVIGLPIERLAPILHEWGA